MINATYLPPAVPATRDLETLTALMQLLADPTTARNSINELAAVAESARTAVAEVHRGQAELAAQMVAHNEAIQRSTREHDEAIAKAKADHDAECERRSIALTARAAAADAREAKVKAAEEANAALRADLDRRLNLLKNAAAA
jgi:hypothetical protein